MSTDYSPILSRIEDLRSGGRANAWHGRCPNKSAHKNGDASGYGSLRLWVCESTGNLLCKCYKGCPWKEINAALGLNGKEWFPAVAPVWFKSSKLPKAAEPMSRTITATYDYVDESGTLLYQVCRCVMADGSKSFFQRRPIGHHGEWTNSLAEGRYKRDPGGTWVLVGPSDPGYGFELKPCRSVPYRLDVITKHEDWPVIVVEGEKDVTTLEEVFAGQSVCITTNSGGAKKWPITHGGVLAGRRVTIFPDNDCVGMEHACMVAASALIYQCESVRVIRWDAKVPDGADVTDWLLEHHAKSTVAQKRSAIIGLIKAAEREEYKRKGVML